MTENDHIYLTTAPDYLMERRLLDRAEALSADLARANTRAQRLSGLIDKLTKSGQELLSDRDHCANERDELIREREDIIRERDMLVEQCNLLDSQLAHTRADQDTLQQSLDAVQEDWQSRFNECERQLGATTKSWVTAANEVEAQKLIITQADEMYRGVCEELSTAQDNIRRQQLNLDDASAIIDQLKSDQQAHLAAGRVLDEQVSKQTAKLEEAYDTIDRLEKAATRDEAILEVVDRLIINAKSLRVWRVTHGFNVDDGYVRGLQTDINTCLDLLARMRDEQTKVQDEKAEETS